MFNFFKLFGKCSYSYQKQLKIFKRIKVYLNDENIRFHTIAVLFAKLPTPKDNRCLHVDMRFSTFDIGSHVISCFREFVIRAEHCELHNNNGVRTTLIVAFFGD